MLFVDFPDFHQIVDNQKLGLTLGKIKLKSSFVKFVSKKLTERTHKIKTHKKRKTHTITLPGNPTCDRPFF